MGPHFVVFGSKNTAGEAPVPDRMTAMHLPHMCNESLLVGKYALSPTGVEWQRAHVALKG